MAGEYAPNVEGTWIGQGGDSMGTFVPSEPGNYVDIGGGGDQSNVVFVPEGTPEQQMQNQKAPSWLPKEAYTSNNFTPEGNSVSADQAATQAAKDLYATILKRDADAEGLKTFKNAILNGSSIADLAKSMLDSSEKQATLDRAKANLMSQGKTAAEVDALISTYKQDVIDIAGAVKVSPQGYVNTLKVLDGANMIAPGQFQRSDGTIISVDPKGNILSATPPYSTYSDKQGVANINKGYRNETYSMGSMANQTSIKINGIDVPLTTPEYLVNEEGKLKARKDGSLVTIQEITPQKDEGFLGRGGGLGGFGDFLQANGLGIVLSLATAGAAAGAASGTLFANAAGAGGIGGAGATLTGLIGGSVGLTGTAATIAGGAVLGSSTSALLAAASGGNVGQAALKGAIGGGVGGASLEIANGLVGADNISAIAEAVGQTKNQVSNIITNAISTAVSAAATGNFNGNILSLIGNSLGSSVLANYAGNIVNSLDPGNLSSVVSAVTAVTKVGASAALNGGDFATAVTNNAGQIIGNYLNSELQKGVNTGIKALPAAEGSPANPADTQTGAGPKYVSDVSNDPTTGLANDTFKQLIAQLYPNVSEEEVYNFLATRQNDLTQSPYAPTADANITVTGIPTDESAGLSTLVKPSAAPSEAEIQAEEELVKKLEDEGKTPEEIQQALQQQKTAQNAAAPQTPENNLASPNFLDTLWKQFSSGVRGTGGNTSSGIGPLGILNGPGTGPGGPGTGPGGSGPGISKVNIPKSSPGINNIPTPSVNLPTFTPKSTAPLTTTKTSGGSGGSRSLPLFTKKATAAGATDDYNLPLFHTDTANPLAGPTPQFDINKYMQNINNQNMYLSAQPTAEQTAVNPLYGTELAAGGQINGINMLGMGSMYPMSQTQPQYATPTQSFSKGYEAQTDPYTGQMTNNLARGGITNLGGYSDGGQLLKGGGTGLSDGIPATIEGKQPARLADGEFVVSADVVSALGGGSTDAGAKMLYAMMDRIRKNAHGTKKQIKAINARKVLPA